MKSMTGFGSSDRMVGAEALSIQLKSLNNRFLEVKVRCPREYAAMEPRIVAEVKKHFLRGYLEIGIGRDAHTASKLPKYALNIEGAVHYAQEIGRAKKRLNLKGDLTLDQILSLPDIWVFSRKKISADAQWAQLRAGLKACVDKVVQMRQREGTALLGVIMKYLSTIEKEISKVKNFRKQLIKSYDTKMKHRLSQILNDERLDPQRLSQEVAFLIDRSDVSEELDRLKSHMKQFRLTARATGSIGRSLDFIVQEMNREINTIGSKVQDVRLTSHIIQCKSLMEKIREQIQNVE